MNFSNQETLKWTHTATGLNKIGTAIGINMLCTWNTNLTPQNKYFQFKTLFQLLPLPLIAKGKLYCALLALME